VDHAPVEVYVVPGELAQLARAQAERDRDDEERFQPGVGIADAVQAELATAAPAGRFLELGGDVGDRRLGVRLGALR
jgi:hypothetical protein